MCTGDDPAATACRAKQAIAKRIEELLVFGTAGACAAGITANIPEQVRQFAWTPDWNYTAVQCLRYGYVLWLLAYFVASAIRNDLSANHRTRRDVGFDVLRAVVSLAAIAMLGFGGPAVRFAPLCGFLVANGAILTVCAAAWALFRRQSTEQLHTLRFAGVILALSGLSLVAMFRLEIGSLTILTQLQVYLWILVGCYTGLNWLKT